MDVVVQLIILIMSVVVHEVAHGYAAESLGDPTARLAGRLTLNPLKHLDPVGSFLVPLITSSLGFTFGWAKPVPYNPYNLRPSRWSEAYVAIAGPLSNIAIATCFGLLIRFASGFFPAGALTIFAMIILVNLSLAIFNLIPIPPLDGSKILFAVLPAHLAHIRENFERFGFILVVIFIMTLSKFLGPVVGAAFHLMTGVAL